MTLTSNEKVAALIEAHSSIEFSEAVSHAQNHEFEESMVKRDGTGRFAKKAGDALLADEEWAKGKNLGELRWKILDSVGDELQAAAQKVADKNGLTIQQVNRKHPKALNEALNKCVEILNEKTKTMGISPSGKQRLNFALSKTKKIYALPVPYSGPVPKKIKVSRAPMPDISKAFPGLPKKKSGGLFNPASDISGGHVSDTSDAKPVIDLIREALEEAQLEALSHDDMLSEFLAHHGVKGQRWGFRKSESSGPRLSETSAGASRASREAAKTRIKAGTGTLKDAHIASLKTAGHRVTNSVLGDKQFWKREAEIAGVVAGVVGLTALAPVLLPAATVSAISLAVSGTAGTAGLTQLGLGIATVVGYAGTTVNSYGNLARAFRGNTRVDNSYAKLGSRAASRQTAGDERTKRILNKAGGISKNKLSHSDDSKFLTLGQVYKGMPAQKRDMFDLIVGAAIENTDISSVEGAGDAYDGMSSDEVNLLNFVVGASLADDVEHSDIVGDFLEHHGILGQRWGFRRQRGSDGTVAGGDGKIDPNAPASPHHAGSTVSEDAKRAADAMSKHPTELSNAELKLIVERHNQLQAYNKIFNPQASGHSEIQQKIEGLRAQKELRNLKAELNPKQPSAVSKLISKGQKGFAAFKAIDKVLQGTLSKGLVDKMGLTPPKTQSELLKSQVDLLKLKNDLLSQQTKSIEKMAELNKTRSSDLANYAIGDFPSMSTGTPGRHRGPAPILDKDGNVRRTNMPILNKKGKVKGHTPGKLVGNHRSQY